MLDPADNLLTASLGTMPVMAIFRGLSIERTLDLAEHAWTAGITCVEVPVQDEASYEVLEATIRAGAVRGKPVGAGTVVSHAQVRRVAELGAAFTVSPGFDEEVARESIDAGLPTLPGVATASEIQCAMRAGFSWLKAFPAAVLGAAWFTAMSGPFPHARFVATGGMSSANAAAFFSAGADVIAVGSSIADSVELERVVAAAAGPSPSGG